MHRTRIARLAMHAGAGVLVLLGVVSPVEGQASPVSVPNLTSQSEFASTVRYSITIDSISGGPGSAPPYYVNNISVSGSVAAEHYSGLLGQYQVEVNWGDGTVNLDSTVNLTPSATGKDFTGTWASNPSHAYLRGGTYTITAMLYHGQPPGRDGAADAFLSISVVVGGSGTLKIVKNSIGGDGTFSFSYDGASSGNATFATIEGVGSASIAVPAGNYAVTEGALPPGWTANGPTTASITVPVNETGTVTFSNIFTRPPTGTLEIVKNAVGGNGTFSFSYAGPSSGNASITTSGGTGNATATVSPGSYTVSEVGLLPGWSTSSNSTSVTVTAGQTAVVTFTNTFSGTGTGTLEIVKNAAGGDATFGFSYAGLTSGSIAFATGEGSGSASITVAAGSYTVSEVLPLPSGWTPEGPTTFSNIVVPVGGTVTVTFSNSFTSTTQGILKIVKNTIGGDGTFSFTYSGPSSGIATVTTVGSYGSVSIAVVAGSYTVSETALPAGWFANSPTTAATTVPINGMGIVSFSNAAQRGGGGGGGPSTGGTPEAGPTTGPEQPPEQLLFAVDFLGKITTGPMSQDGRLLEDLNAPSPDGSHLLRLPKNNRTLDSQGNVVTLILVREAAPVPELPAGAVLIGKAYDFTPSGATFDGQVALTLGYDVNSLPEGITSIWIATYHTSPGWEALTAQQNRVAGADSVTASFSRFSIFAVLAAVRGASFSAANLNISPSQRTLWPAFPLISLSGREVNISADASNNGGQQGTYALSLIVDSQVKGQKSISLSPSQTQKVTFSLRGVGFGRHAVQLGGVTGQFVTSFSINWWLLVAIILVLALLGWLISRYARGRTKRREEGQPG